MTDRIFFLAIPREIDYFSFLLFFDLPQPCEPLKSMKLAFDEITVKTDRYTIKEWCQGEDRDFTVTATATIAVCRRDNDTVLLTGELAGQFTVACARCGEPVEQDLQSEFEYLITTQKEDVSELQEVECSNEQADTLYLKEPEIDVDAILREQTYLAVPMKALCSEDCRGLCPGCGACLNSESCRCPDDNSSSPFAVLGKLRNK
ncbi:MAG: YceD family protein [Desulforhopalus sp.]